MKRSLLIIISFISLALTIVPAFLVSGGSVTSAQNKLYMLIGTIGWFCTAPFWMKAPKPENKAPE